MTRQRVDLLVARLIEAQRRLSASAGPAAVAGVEPSLPAAEFMHRMTLETLLNRLGTSEELAPSEGGDHPLSVLVRIGILGNAINRLVNALDDQQLAERDVESLFGFYFRWIDAYTADAPHGDDHH